MADTFKLSVNLDFEVEKKEPITDSESATIEYVQQALGVVLEHFIELQKDPAYLGAKVVVSIPQNAVKLAE